MTLLMCFVLVCDVCGIKLEGSSGSEACARAMEQGWTLNDKSFNYYDVCGGCNEVLEQGKEQHNV